MEPPTHLEMTEMTEISVEIETYPVAIIQDRYRGTYAGAEWIAIANADEADCELDVAGLLHKVCGVSRVQYCLMDGPHASDPDAVRFWANPPDWIAVGTTPDEALQALRARYETRGKNHDQP